MIPLLEFERGPAGPQRPALPNIGIFEAQPSGNRAPRGRLTEAKAGRALERLRRAVMLGLKAAIGMTIGQARTRPDSSTSGFHGAELLERMPCVGSWTKRAGSPAGRLHRS